MQKWLLDVLKKQKSNIEVISQIIEIIISIVDVGISSQIAFKPSLLIKLLLSYIHHAELADKFLELFNCLFEDPLSVKLIEKHEITKHLMLILGFNISPKLLCVSLKLYYNWMRNMKETLSESRYNNFIEDLLSIDAEKIFLKIADNTNKEVAAVAQVIVEDFFN